MNLTVRSTADETRERILAAAEELFRRIGYYKTTVGDIAEALGMSNANIYRFFSSKMAINEALCARVLAALLEDAQRVASGHGTARERVFNLLMTLHRHHREQMTNQERVHEMVAVAMEEDWASIETFIHSCRRLVGEIVAEGQASGEFGPGDPMMLGDLAFNACAGVLHPVLITKCAREGLTGGEIDAKAQGLAAFALHALTNRESFPLAPSQEP